MISFSFTSLLFLIITVQSSVLGVILLVSPREKKISTVFLACFLLVLALHMGLNFLYEEFPATSFPNITYTLGFLYGPLFFLYVRSTVLKSARFSLRTALHFLPWIFFTIIWLFTKIDWLGIFILVQEVVYIVLIIVSVRNFQQALRQTQSRYHVLSLHWLIQFLFFIILVAFVDGLNNWFTFSKGFSAVSFNLLLGTLILFVNALFFKGMRQPLLFGGISDEEMLVLRELNKEKRVSAEMDLQNREIAEKVSRFMQEQKPFLQPELSLEDLARDTGVGIRMLSLLINTVFKTNFSDYINDFRIQHAQHLLLTSTRSQKTVSEIMFESGFNSKSSFYLAFKKKMGISPSDYRKQLDKRETK